MYHVDKTLKERKKKKDYALGQNAFILIMCPYLRL